MVSSLLVDALKDPTCSLLELYDPTTQLDAFPALVSSHFSQIFSSVDAFQEIPPLDVHNPPEAHLDRSIVRFRAMVQDTSPSPEMYLAKRSGGRCGGWGLGEETDASFDDDRRESINYADLRECTVVWAVTIPGESTWCKSQVDGPMSNNATASSTRSHRPQQPHKFPVPNTPHVGVQVKVYDHPHNALKSTDLLTFVGVLTSEPLHADLGSPTPTLVPTLHVLFSQHLPPTIIPCSYPYSPDGINIPTIKQLREELISWIADEALGGDRDAAEWVLLCAIARVQSRMPPILPPSLTLSRFPIPPSNAPNASPPVTADRQTAPTLTHVLASLLPTLLPLPLSLQTLNTTPFIPESKDEDLHSGWLQLPSGSICLVTEGGVREGGVCDRGIHNLRAMQEMMMGQTLEYVFPYSKFSFPTDVAFLVVCEGSRSAFFQTNINIPLQSAPTSHPGLYKSAEAVQLPPQAKLEMFRSLMCGAKVGSVKVGEGTAEYIQEDFVKERKEAVSEGRKAVTSEDLILRMTVARLLALSLHELEVTIDIWERSKMLEGKRGERVRVAAGPG